ncbi:MAG: hypothetical protein C4340_04370 [Armatimonadota bacterium]
MLPWFLLFGGGFAVGRYAPYLSALAGGSDADVKRSVVVVHPWRDDLVGARVRLPSEDLWGRSIPRNRPVFVVTISCTSCGDPSSLLKQLHQSHLRPVVVVSEAFTPEYAEALRTADGIVALETRVGDAVVPDQMLKYAPQVALVDAQGKITAVPSSATPLELFLRLGGNQE